MIENEEPEPQLIRYLQRAASMQDDIGGIRFLDRRENSEWINWPTFYQRIKKTAGALQEKGVRAGDFVGIILPTCPEFIDCFLACQLMGAIPVPLYPPVRLGRMAEYFQRTAVMAKSVNAVAVITNKRVVRVLGKLLPLYTPPLGLIDAKNLVEGPELEPNWTSPDSLAMVQFSSGTTVDPKPVALSHRQIISNALCLTDAVLTVESNTPAGVSWLPLYHDMGLIGCILPSIIGPGPLTLIAPEDFLANPSLWLRALSKYKGTVSPAPNFAYSLCLERVSDEQMQGCDLSSWRMALCGAEPISPNTMRDFTRRFSQWGLPETAITPVYGLSEASLAVSFADLKSTMKTTSVSRQALAEGRVELSQGEDGWEMVSVGKALPGFEIQIRDDQGQVLAEGCEGTIYVAGPSVCDGYLGRDESPVEAGYLNTGDLGFILDEELYISGRAKDVIVLRGQNHIPYEIERALEGVEGVRTGCAAAVGSIAEDGESLFVFAEYRGKQADDELAERCKRAITAATSLVPDLMILLEAGTLPRTSSGKIRRAETLKLWNAGTLTSADKVTPWLLAGAMAQSWSARIAHRIKNSQTKQRNG